MNILIISYFCYPDKSSAGLRSYGFSKYLQEEGVKIHLLTSLSQTQLLQIQDKINVTSVSLVSKSKLREWGYKTKILVIMEYLKLDKLLFFPDPYFMWIKRATKKAEQIIEEHNIDIILAIGMPFSDFVVGYTLSKKFDIPLVIDYQDPWSGSPLNPQPKFTKKRTKKLERKIIDQSSAIVTCGEMYSKIIRESTKTDKKMHIIHHGYLKEPQIKETKIEKEDDFTISYFGNFYGDLTKSLECLLGGMSKVIEDTNNDMIFQYAGSTSRNVLGRLLDKTGMTNHFKDLDYLDKAQLFKSIRKSHLNFIPHPKTAAHASQTKLFDYIRNNSHILFVGEYGYSIELCEEIEQKYTLLPPDKEKIVEGLKDLYDKFLNNELDYGCNQKKMEFYSRKNQARRLLEILKELV